MLQDGDQLVVAVTDEITARVHEVVERAPHGRRALMRVAIVGAGAVGRSIAGELLGNGHTVMLIEKDGRKVRTRSVPGAEWVQADACEVSSLEEAQLATCDVVVAATGDDKANLVVSLLAKTEFAVNRVVARVKDPRNEWLYTEAWGVDVAVSTPRVLAALVEEAVTVGDVVRLMSFRKGAANLVEITLAEDTPWVGKPLRDVPAAPRDGADRDPARRAGHHPVRRRAAGGRRRAAVRHPRRGRGPAEDGARARDGGRGDAQAPAPASAGPARQRCRCSRATTQSVTTTSTAVSGRPSTRDAVPSSSTSSGQVQQALDQRRAAGT